MQIKIGIDADCEVVWHSQPPPTLHAVWVGAGYVRQTVKHMLKITLGMLSQTFLGISFKKLIQQRVYCAGLNSSAYSHYCSFFSVQLRPG